MLFYRFQDAEIVSNIHLGGGGTEVPSKAEEVEVYQREEIRRNPLLQSLVFPLHTNDKREGKFPTQYYISSCPLR